MKSYQDYYVCKSYFRSVLFIQIVTIKSLHKVLLENGWKENLLFLNFGDGQWYDVIYKKRNLKTPPLCCR